MREQGIHRLSLDSLNERRRPAENGLFNLRPAVARCDEFPEIVPLSLAAGEGCFYPMDTLIPVQGSAPRGDVRRSSQPTVPLPTRPVRIGPHPHYNIAKASLLRTEAQGKAAGRFTAINSSTDLLNRQLQCVL